MPSRIAGKFALELDNASAGWLFNAEGAHAERAGHARHTLTFGGGMSEAFYAWIAASLAGTAAPRTVAVGSADAMQWVEIADARVTRLGVQGGWWTLEVSGEHREPRRARPGRDPVVADDDRARKAWMVNNYEVNARVNKIEALSVQPGPQPRLTIVLGDPVDLFTSADGRGTVTARDDDGQALFTLEFTRRLTPDKVEAGGEQLRRGKAEVVCESVRFTFTDAALG